MCHSTHHRSFRRRFYGYHNPTNSAIALKDDGQSTRSRANPTRLSSLKGKEKDVSKKNVSIYIAPLRPKTQRCLEDRELNLECEILQKVHYIKTLTFTYFKNIQGPEISRTFKVCKNPDVNRPEMNVCTTNQTTVYHRQIIYGISPVLGSAHHHSQWPENLLQRSALCQQVSVQHRQVWAEGRPSLESPTA